MREQVASPHEASQDLEEKLTSSATRSPSGLIRLAPAAISHDSQVCGATPATPRLTSKQRNYLRNAHSKNVGCTAVDLKIHFSKVWLNCLSLIVLNMS